MTGFLYSVVVFAEGLYLISHIMILVAALIYWMYQLYGVRRSSLNFDARILAA